ncbi:SRPBCC family protein, partial [Ilumatobacter sp.]
MEIIERTRTLAVRADEVWAVLSDFGAISSWASNVDHSCLLTDQPDGVG